MATHSSILVWKIPWTEEPGGLQSMGSQRSRTRLSDYYYVSAFIVSLSYLALGLAFFCQMTSAGNNRKSHSIWPKGQGNVLSYSTESSETACLLCTRTLGVLSCDLPRAALAQQPDDYSSSRHHFQRSRQRKGLTTSSMCLFLKSEKMFLQQSSHHIIIGQVQVTGPFLNQSLEKGITYFSLIIWRWDDVWRVNHPDCHICLS